MFIIYLLVIYLIICFICGVISSLYNLISGSFGFNDRLILPNYIELGFYIAIFIMIIISL